MKTTRSRALLALALTLVAIFAQPVAARAVTYGETVDLGGNSNHQPNFLLGSRVVVTAPFTLNGFGVLFRTTGYAASMGLYTDVEGEPGTLVAQTGSFDSAMGWVVQPATAPVSVSAGAYWLVAVFPEFASVGIDLEAGPEAVVKYRSLAFTGTLPESFGPTETYEGQRFNFYITGTVLNAPATTLLYAKGGTLPTAGTDPNIPAGAVWHGFGIPAIDDAGKVAFVAKWKNPAGSPLGSYGTGVFVDGALRVYAGQEVGNIPGTTFKKFRDPVISHDHLALVATIEGSFITNENDTVVIRVRPSGEVTALAQEGISGTFPTAAAWVDGATIKAFKSVDISGGSLATGPSGILYTATLNQGSGTPAVTSTTDYAAWLFRDDTTTLVVREGATATGLAPGETVKSFTLLKAISGSPGQRRGHAQPQLVDFFAKLSTGRHALLDHFAGLTGTTRLTGETVGGGSFPTATWKSFGPLADNVEDAYAMKASITGGGVSGSSATGIFYTVGSPDDTWEDVAFVGDDAGSGTTFAAFKDPVLQGSSGIKVAFGTTLVDGGGAKSSAIYWTPAAAPARLASQGTAAPGGGTFAKFTSLAYPGGGIGPVFLASLALGVDGSDKANDIGLWVTGSSGTLHKAVREGDAISGKTIKTLTVLKTVSGSPGTTHAFNADGAIVSRAAFTDGTSGIIKTTVP